MLSVATNGHRLDFSFQPSVSYGKVLVRVRVRGMDIAGIFPSNLPSPPFLLRVYEAAPPDSPSNPYTTRTSADRRRYPSLAHVAQHPIPQGFHPRPHGLFSAGGAPPGTRSAASSVTTRCSSVIAPGSFPSLFGIVALFF